MSAHCALRFGAFSSCLKKKLAFRLFQLNRAKWTHFTKWNCSTETAVTGSVNKFANRNEPGGEILRQCPIENYRKSCNELEQATCDKFQHVSTRYNRIQQDTTHLKGFSRLPLWLFSVFPRQARMVRVVRHQESTFHSILEFTYRLNVHVLTDNIVFDI